MNSCLGGIFCNRFCSSSSFWISRSNGPTKVDSSVLFTFELGECLSRLLEGEDSIRRMSFLSVCELPSRFVFSMLDLLLSGSRCWSSSSVISSASLKLGDRLKFVAPSLLHSNIESLSFRVRFSKLRYNTEIKMKINILACVFKGEPYLFDYWSSVYAKSLNDRLWLRSSDKFETGATLSPAALFTV